MNKRLQLSFIIVFSLGLFLVTFTLLFYSKRVLAQGLGDCECGRCATLYCAENCPGESMCIWGANQACECCTDCGGGACFTGDTPIRMADDTEKPIEDIEVGEMVKSFDPETGEITESEVTKVYEHSKEETEGYYILTTESGRQVKVTPEHPFLAMKTSETMSPLELSLLKTKAALLSAARKIQGLLF